MKIKLFYYNTIVDLLLILLAAGILTACLRGNIGNPTPADLQEKLWTNDGPLELSPERGRFALTYSLIEDNSLSFSVPIARFAIPDLGYKNGKYVSLFAPGVSFIVAPGYIIGRYFGISQAGTNVVIVLFALANAILIYRILRRISIDQTSARLAALIFLFASPAFNYAVTLYQHHISTFLLLGSVYLLLTRTSWTAYAVIWFLIALSIPVDYPNLFLMLPIAFWALNNTLRITTTMQGNILRISMLKLFSISAVLLPLGFFLWFNNASYGNPMQFSGTVATVKAIDQNGKPTAPENASITDREKYINPEKQQKSASNFFRSRALVNGLFILLFSPDRGLLYFAPFILLVIPGLLVAYRLASHLTVIMLSIIGINILLYSMWGDPWGGWAFGPRYLIPTCAFASLLLGMILSQWRGRLLYTLAFIIIISFSILVNTAGALTSSANPPRIEVLNLEKLSGREEKYTFERNIDMLREGRSKSILYNAVFKQSITAWGYYKIITGIIISTAIILTILTLYKSKLRL
jgi:hypothetical protein